MPFPVQRFWRICIGKSSFAVRSRDENEITEEILSSRKRVGADMIVTYFAKPAAKFMQES